MQSYNTKIKPQWSIPTCRTLHRKQSVQFSLPSLLNDWSELKLTIKSTSKKPLKLIASVSAPNERSVFQPPLLVLRIKKYKKDSLCLLLLPSLPGLHCPCFLFTLLSLRWSGKMTASTYLQLVKCFHRPLHHCAICPLHRASSYAPTFSGKNLHDPSQVPNTFWMSLTFNQDYVTKL